MQITIEDLSPVEKRVVFELPWVEVETRLDKAYGALRKDVRLKGFRPGKAPRSVLEQLYKQSVQDDVARELIELSMSWAVREKQIEPVSPARVEKIEIEKGKPFKVTAQIDVRSQVEPKDYEGIALTRRAPKISDEQITAALEQQRQRLTQFVPVEGRATAASTDVLSVTLNGRVGEHKIKKADVMVDLSNPEGGPLPGLVEALIGKELGEGKVHEINYKISPDDPRKELNGREVSLRATLKEVREKRVPNLDDEFAKDTGEADTLDALKAKIRERLENDDKERIKRELQIALTAELVKRNSFPLAPSIVDRFAEHIVNRTRQQLAMMGVDVRNMDPTKMLADARPDAERDARASILLRAIGEKEGLEVTEADLQKHMAEIAAQRQESLKKVRTDLEQGGRLPGLRAHLLEEKALDKLLAAAKITDGEPSK